MFDLPRLKSPLILLLTASLWTQASLAASSCREVLVPSVSAESVQVTIDGLANLRMTLDLKKSEGSKGPTVRAMELDYELKLRELAKYLHTGVFEVRTRIRSRIPELQKVTQKNEEDSKRARDSEKAIVLPLYEAKETITDLAAAFSTKNVPRWIQLLEDQSKLVYEQNRALQVLDLKTNTVEVLAQDVMSVISNDSKTVLVLDDNGILDTYSTDTLQKLGSVQLDFKTNHLDLSRMWPEIEMNAQGDRVAVGYEVSAVLIFDVATGKLVGENLDPSKAIGLTFKFYSNTELIIANGHTLTKYDLQNKTLKVNNTFSDGRAMSVAVNPARGELTTVMSNKKDLGATTVFFRADDLSVITMVDGHTYHHIPAPGSKRNLTLVTTPENPLGLFESTDRNKPTYDFLDHYKDGLKIPDQAQFSRDGSSIYVFYREKEINGKTIKGIDVWKRTPGKAY